MKTEKHIAAIAVRLAHAIRAVDALQETPLTEWQRMKKDLDGRLVPLSQFDLEDLKEEAYHKLENAMGKIKDELLAATA